MAGFTTKTRELSLQEMLADPIVQMMMVRDGVTKHDVECLVETVRDRIANRQMVEYKNQSRRAQPSAFERYGDGQSAVAIIQESKC